MGALCTSLFGQSQTTTYQPPEAVKNAITDILNRASTQSNQPYPEYTPAKAAQYMNYVPGLVSPLTPNQVYAGQSISDLQGYTDPNFAAATALASNAATPIQMQQYTPEAVNQYMNPYMGDVVNAAVQNINQTNAQQQQQVLGNAIQRGAFGGDRAGIAQAELARQQDLANNATISNLLNQGYTQAQGQFNQQQGQDLTTQLQNRGLLNTGAINLANLGTQGQQTALQQAQAQYQYGTAEQQQQQAALSTAYQQYMNQQAFPYQQLSYYAGLASGAAPAMGGSTTGYTPTVAPGTGVLGTFATLNSLSGGSSGVNPLSFLGNAAATAASGGLYADGGRANHAEGGRAGYATGGGPTSQSIVQAYNDYVNLISSGRANPAQIDAAYKKYITAFQNAPAPYDDTTTTTKTTTTPVAKTDTTSTNTADNARVASGGINNKLGSTTGINTPYIDSSSGVSGVAGLTADGGIGDAGYSLGLPEAGKKGITAKGVLSQLVGGVDPLTGAQTGIAGAINALVKGNSPGSLNAVLNAPNTVAYGKRADNSAYPNTSTGMTAQEWADKFADGDISKVSGSVVNGQIDWFRNDNAVANAVHPGALPAAKLNELIGPVAQANEESEADLPAQNARNASTADDTESEKTINLGDINKAYGLPEGYLGGQLYKESGFNPDATAKGSSATGIAQFTKGTAQGLGVDPKDVVSSVYGAATLGQQNAQGLSNRGLPVNAQTLSLAHQFGLAGAAAILSNPNQSIFDSLKTVQGEDQALKAVVGNGFNISDTSGSVANQVGRDFTASMRLANQAGLDIPTRTLQSESLSSQPENVGQRGIAAAAADQKPDSGVVGVSGTTDQGGIGNAGYSLGLGGDKLSTPVSIGEQVGSAGNKTDESGEKFTGNESSQSQGPEKEESTKNESKRGGLILAHPHHYAAGGYAPISMQYGLPTQDELSQLYADYAGTGVGQLGAQQYASAAKGLLPSATAAKGGRIGYANLPGGSGAVTNDDEEYNLAGNADLNEGWAAPAVKFLDSLTAKKDQKTLTEPMLPIDDNTGQEIKPQAPQPEMVGTGYFDDATGQEIKVPKNPNRSLVGTGVYNDATGQEIKMPAKEPIGSGRGVVEKPGERASALASANQGSVSADQFDLGPAPTPRNVQVAQDTTRTRSDAPQPGFGYIAPNPADMRNFFGLNYGLSLLSGSSIAAAGDNYAKNILAQQAEQRAQMEAQGRTAQSYAGSQNLQAEALARGRQPTPAGASEIYVGADGKQHYREITEEGGSAALPNLPGLPGSDGKPVAPSSSDAAYGPIYLGGDVPATAVSKDQTLQAMGAPFKKQALGTNAPTLQKQFAEMKTAAQQEATVAQNTQTDLAMAVKASAGLGQSQFLSPGAAIGLRTTIANYFKTLGDMVGMDMSGVTADNLTSQQVLNKLSTLQAQAQQRGLGREAGFWLNTVKQAYPNESTTKETSNDLLASMIVSTGRVKDRANVYNQYGVYSGQMGADAPQVFDKINPSAGYNNDIRAISDILNHTINGPNGQPENLVTALQNGHLKGGVAAFDAAAKQRYGVVNLSRYFQ